MTFRDKNTCFVKLRNLSKELVSEEVVQLFIEDKQVGAKTVEIEGMSELIVPISFIARDTGTIRGKISIEDYPITFDDDFYFTFDIAPSVNVAIISSSITKNLIAKAYKQDEIFNIQLWNETTIDFLKLPTIDIIIFDRLNNFSDNLILSLEQLLDNNQSIVIIPSEKDKKLSYKNLFKRIDIRYIDAGDISKDRYTLKVPTITNPLFKDVFERISSNMDMPWAQPMIRWQQSGTPWLYYRDNTPFLTSWAMSNSTIWLFASPLSEEMSNMKYHSLFIPIMYNIAFKSKKLDTKLYHTYRDRFIEIEATNGLQRSSVLSIESEDFKIVPAQRRVGESIFLTIEPEQMTANHYDIKDTKTGAIYNHIAINYNSQESDIDYYSTEELTEISKKYPSMYILDANHKNLSSFESLRDKYTIIELWRYALMLAIIAIAAEMAMILLYKDTMY